MEPMEHGGPVPGRWVHSFEEDVDDIEVYRPEEHAFPPTRGGRQILEVTPDGTLIEWAAGPDDRPIPTGVEHAPAGMNRYTTTAPVSAGAGATKEDTGPGLEIVEAGPEILRIARQP